MKQKDERHPVAKMRHDNSGLRKGGAHDPKKGGPYRRAKGKEQSRRAMRDAEREE